jgi:hypothetical protein
VSNAMAFFWLLFWACAVCAWLIGYGMGYLKGVRGTTANVRDGDSGEDWSGPINRSSDAAPDVATADAEPVGRRQLTSGERHLTNAG